MSATKEYHHDLIEKQQREYNILELNKLNMLELLEIAANMNITVGDAESKQPLIDAILKQQAQ